MTDQVLAPGTGETTDLSLPAVEVRSIDYVPSGERHGKVWHQAAFWFMGNFVLLTMSVGFLGASFGLSLAWTVLAIVLGCSFGTFFAAFHAVQGPRMGMPQMIQSRAQFGYQGVIVPLLVVLLVYVGFNVFDTVLAAQGLDVMASASKWVWYPLIAIVAVAIAIVGHDFLHRIQRVMTVLSLAVFGLLTIGAIVDLHFGSVAAKGGFDITGFLVMFSAATGYQISYAVYVSDYTRYLPEDTKAGPVIWWVYLGMAGSAIWLMSLGALIAGAFAIPDPIGSVKSVGDDIFGGFGTIVVVVGALGLTTSMAMNGYGAMLTTVTSVDSFRSITPTRALRIAGIVFVGLLWLVIAVTLPGHYLTDFNNFVLFMLYFLIPWTAVNLVDFYFVRRGHYAISEIFKPQGMYGRVGWRGLTAYFVALAAMTPFFTTTFYTGPASKALDGVDISFAVGLIVAAGLYFVFSRSLDLEAEAALEKRSREAVEALASEHLTPGVAAEQEGDVEEALGSPES
jgi:nucleobase:cation symporter-1, NCS1 family